LHIYLGIIPFAGGLFKSDSGKYMPTGNVGRVQHRKKTGTVIVNSQRAVVAKHIYERGYLRLLPVTYS